MLICKVGTITRRTYKLSVGISEMFGAVACWEDRVSPVIMVLVFSQQRLAVGGR